MSTNIIRWERDDEDFVTLVFDDPNHRANTMNSDYDASMQAAIGQLRAERDSIRGVVIASAKETFFAGGNIADLAAVTDDTLDAAGQRLRAMKADLRALETLGIPVVAALGGTALGGGLEIALACHRRIALDNPKARFGLPEVTLGLLPGGGGVTRVTRLLGVVDGLTKVLMRGQQMTAREALEAGLLDELVGDDVVGAAKAWLRSSPPAVQRWDAPDYRMPGGRPSDPAVALTMPALPGRLRQQLNAAPMPAPHHIMCAAVEGAVLDLDSAFEIESRYFLDLIRGQVAKNMIRAVWTDPNEIRVGGSRPAGFPVRTPQRVAVLGAGMMGAGIAYVTAAAGAEVVLKDVSIEAAERGKDYSRRLVAKAVARERLSQEAGDALLARISTVDDYAGLAGCDLVVEAVFESPALKHDVLAATEAVVADDALLGSNTSTLPITSLAEGVRRRADFVGLHFFSPVDRMPLVEVIRGAQTSDAALARAVDFATFLRKTPIVVNDSRGFFTSRVIGTLLNEAISMIAEGVPPATVEQATLQAGYPVGALQLADELNMELFVKIRDENRAAAGAAYVAHPAEAVYDRLVEFGRPGRLAGAGFYDYQDGDRSGLWPGLRNEFPPVADPAAIDLHELSERLLVIEAVEAARCLEEGVLFSVAEANVGSILGIGYPVWTGGVLQYINGYGAPPGGVAAFVARADEFAERYGERFTPNPLLRKKADNGETF